MAGGPGDQRRAGPSRAGASAAGRGAQPGWETPWAEPFRPPGRGGERADLATAFAAAMRRTGALMQLMGTAAADRIGINATDLNCLNILSFSGQHDGRRAGPGHRADHRVDHRGG